jgi:hypothetical protein
MRIRHRHLLILTGACMVGAQAQPKKIPVPPPKPMLLSVSSAATTELSPAGPQVLSTEIYGMDGGQIFISAVATSQFYMESLSLSIPPNGFGTGMFEISAPHSQPPHLGGPPFIAHPVVELDLPGPNTRHTHNVLPSQLLSAGGVYPVVATAVDRAGRAKTIQITYKVLNDYLTTSGSTLNWTTANAITRQLFFWAPKSLPVLIDPALREHDSYPVTPGVYAIVVSSPHDPSPDAPSATNCGMQGATPPPDATKPDRLCRFITVSGPTPPTPNGYVPVNLIYTFDVSGCPPSSSSETPIVRWTFDSKNGGAHYVAITSGSYPCEDASGYALQVVNALSVLPDDYQITAVPESGFVGGNALNVACEKALTSFSGEIITANGGVDNTGIPVQSCDASSP